MDSGCLQSRVGLFDILLCLFVGLSFPPPFFVSEPLSVSSHGCWIRMDAGFVPLGSLKRNLDHGSHLKAHGVAGNPRISGDWTDFSWP